ncbi:nucleotidyltransferase domain-containing protein [Vibrio harveyi]|uniref:nucleotidyltransferase domain-containing protein n=1 Tax=Vibrio harveyi TaxID=669 RepID=UPI003CEC6E69
MESRKLYSEKVVEQIREELTKAFPSDFELAVVVTGSFGRNEASEASDMDWFVVAKEQLSDTTTEEVRKTVTEIVDRHVSKNVGDTGTFGGVVTKNELLVNFGGDEDTNKKFTRRMLYLLESKWLFNKDFYEELKNEILSRYIKNGVPDSGLNRFILNDVIRYYRTICTDYEFKVYENEKKWGVRKIKLRFSRKLLYFSGLITVASTGSMSRALKLEKTEQLLSLSPIERIQYIFGKEQTSTMMSYYSQFLEEISKDSVRTSLDEVERENRNQNEDYRNLKNLSEHFNWEMEKCFMQCFPPSHPIHAAMIF